MTPPVRITLDDGLVLRRWTPEDASALHAAVLASFELLHPWLPWAGERPTLADQQALVAMAEEQWNTGESYMYGIFDSADERVLGAAGLHARVGPDGYDIGYWVYADHTGRGLATRAAGALTDAGLALPDVDRIEIRCDEANTASVAIPKRLGYHLDRVEEREPAAPAESGRLMIWVKRRA